MNSRKGKWHSLRIAGGQSATPEPTWHSQPIPIHAGAAQTCQSFGFRRAWVASTIWREIKDTRWRKAAVIKNLKWVIWFWWKRVVTQSKYSTSTYLLSYKWTWRLWLESLLMSEAWARRWHSALVEGLGGGGVDRGICLVDLAELIGILISSQWIPGIDLSYFSVNKIRSQCVQ